MTRNLNYLVIVSLLFIFGCKPNAVQITTVNTNPDMNLHQIQNITYDTDPDSKRWFEYNAAGDFTKHGSFGDTITYTYAKNKITKKYNKKTNTIHVSVIYTIDDSGMISNSEIYEENDKMVSKYLFEYNAEKYLVKLTREDIRSGRKQIQTYTYMDGNLFEVNNSDEAGNLNSKFVYEFYSDKVNHLNLFNEQILEDILPNERLGKLNKNLIRQFVYLDISGDTLSHIKYEYLDEGDKNVVVQKETDVLNESETIIRFHFEEH